MRGHRTRTVKRMETVDEEFLGASLRLIDRAHKAGKRLRARFNSQRCIIWTHRSRKSGGKTGSAVIRRPMANMGGQWSGQLSCKKLDDLGIRERHGRSLHQPDKRREDRSPGPTRHGRRSEARRKPWGRRLSRRRWSAGRAMVSSREDWRSNEIYSGRGLGAGDHGGGGDSPI